MNLPPKPVADRDTQPFWDAVAERRLVVPRCAACDHWIWQPRPLCPRCHAADPTWVEVPGDATVTSWTVVYPPVLPVWGEAVPFTILLVELEDAPGVRMIGQLLEPDGSLTVGEASDLGIDFGTPLSLAWRQDESNQILPGWTQRS